MTCRFCPELLSELRASEFHEITERKIRSRFIWESDNFVTFPALGHIVPGHVLLVTKRHRLSMSQLPPDLYGELEESLDVTRERLASVFGSPVLVYEHGQVNPLASCGACVDHAHLHVVPVPMRSSTGGEIAPDPAVRATLTAQYREREITRFAELAALSNEGRGYLFVESTTRQRFHYDADAVPSQYLRRVVCDAIGKSDRWDWRTNILSDGVDGTIAIIRETMTLLGQGWGNVNGDLGFDRTMNLPEPSDTCP